VVRQPQAGRVAGYGITFRVQWICRQLVFAITLENANRRKQALPRLCLLIAPIPSRVDFLGPVGLKPAHSSDQTCPWIVSAPSGVPNLASVSTTRPPARPIAVTSPGWSQFAGSRHGIGFPIHIQSNELERVPVTL
jgi:hypothetical protein